MWSIRRRLRLLGCAVAVTALAAACTGSGSYGGDETGGSGGSAGAGGTLRIGWGLDLLTLDPPNEAGVLGLGVIHNVYQTLVEYDFSSAKVKPGLAERWSVGDGGRTYTFHLDDEATFANGDPVTAKDVKFSLDRVTEWKEALQGFQIAPFLAGGSVTAVDDTTVRIELAKPYGGLLTALTGTASSVLSADQVEKASSTVKGQRAWLKDHSAGSGPYVVDTWEPNGFITLERNDNYWRTRPTYKSVQIEFLTEAAQQEAALKRGDLDVGLDLMPQQAENLAKAGFRIDGGVDPSTYYLAMNMSAKPFQDSDVRKAVRYAIDYDGITKTLMHGRAVKAGGVVPEGMIGHDPGLDDMYETDRAKAKDLLRKAGHPNGFTFTLHLATDTVKGLGVPTRTLATKLQSDLAAVGITMKLKVQDINTLFPSYQAGKLPAVLWYFGPTYPDPDPIVSPHGDWDTQATTRLGYHDRKLTAQIQRARTMTDQSERGDAYKQIGRSVGASGPYAFMFRPMGTAVVAKDVKGFRWTPIWTMQLS